MPTTRKNRLVSTDSIVFYDDDVENNITPFRESYPNIKSIIVTDKPPYNQILKGRSHFYYPSMFLKKYKNNTYAQEIVKQMKINEAAPISNICNQCSNNTNQGITMKEINRIIKWANHKTEQERTILFDWDNTISVCNGIYIPTQTSHDWYNNTDRILQQHKIAEEDVAKYCAGTLERFQALVKMFHAVRQNKIHCHILTNNGWGNMTKTKYPLIDLFFLKVVQAIDPWMSEADIIYGRTKGKVQTFKETKFLMTRYKALSKSNKSNKTKKNTKQTKQTKQTK